MHSWCTPCHPSSLEAARVRMVPPARGVWSRGGACGEGSRGDRVVEHVRQRAGMRYARTTCQPPSTNYAKIRRTTQAHRYAVPAYCTVLLAVAIRPLHATRVVPFQRGEGAGFGHPTQVCKLALLHSSRAVAYIFTTTTQSRSMRSSSLQPVYKRSFASFPSSLLLIPCYNRKV